MTRIRASGAALFILMVLSAPAAFAQGSAEMPNARPPPNDRPPAVQPPQQAENPAKKLERSDGVIRPPGNVDPGMKQTPPATGSNNMPILPPPGTPQNKPDIQPK
jgi:hypothetical protein